MVWLIVPLMLTQVPPTPSPEIPVSSLTIREKSIDKTQEVLSLKAEVGVPKCIEVIDSNGKPMKVLNCELPADIKTAKIIREENGDIFFVAWKEDTYRLICYTTGPGVWCKIVVNKQGEVKPTPDKPDVKPTPDPVVPVPPKPVEPVKPLSVLAVQLKTAIDLDGGTANNKENLLKLRDMCVAIQAYINEDKVKFSQALVDKVSEASAIFVDNKLQKLRDLFLVLLKKEIGEDNLFLTPARKEQLTAFFKSIETAMNEVITHE